jgi:hypothetical protein
MSRSTTANIPTAEQDKLLDQRFDDLQGAIELLVAPAHLELELVAAFKSQHAKAQAGKRRRELIAHWFAPGFALAASVGMSAWMVLAPMAQPVPEAIQPGDAQLYVSTPFFALQSLDQIALEPQPRVIETAVPRMWLASYGVPVSPETAGDSLRAEMLVSATGQPLAMRFLP